MAKRKTNPFKKFTEEELLTLAKALRQVDSWGLKPSVISSLQQMCEVEHDNRRDQRIDEMFAAYQAEKAGE